MVAPRAAATRVRNQVHARPAAASDADPHINVPAAPLFAAQLTHQQARQSQRSGRACLNLRSASSRSSLGTLSGWYLSAARLYACRQYIQ